MYMEIEIERGDEDTEKEAEKERGDEIERGWGLRHGERHGESGRTVNTTSIGHKKSKSFKTRFCKPKT